ncbi:hypothetical protein [Tenacibaculum jejuense]|uniref:Uncharacterized protein n=1 Tax=Tenacibaculum jejuense TaxID=584609 RepID=A0A238UBR8_9FLAO|nr:hypothetical protein [Tenacibaculum jejuense]SNR16426.1 Probable transmembrane protein of unknown function [Tenacibaculum jejuense]
MKLKSKIVIFVALLMLILYWISSITEGKYYKSYSPDGQYSIYASRNKFFNFNFPFAKFGDAAGKIHLYDELKEKLITSRSVEMISLVDDHFFWSEEELYMKARMYIKLPRKIDPRIIRQYDKSYPVKYAWTVSAGEKSYTVTENRSRLTVKDMKGALIFKNIKAIYSIPNGFQVLTNDTKIEYYDANLFKIKGVLSQDKDSVSDVIYNLKIEEGNENYLVKKRADFSNYKVINTISKNNVNAIYFINKKREIQSRKDSYENEVVIIDYGTYFGVLSEKHGISYFDTVDINSKPIKVSREGLVGYYGTTSVIFKAIKPFEFNLAAFEKLNQYGKIETGYVDTEGKIYYN